MYLLNNYENLTNTVLKNVEYFYTDTTYYDEDDNEIDIDDVDTNEVEVFERTEEIFDRKRQKNIFEKRVSQIPSKVLQQPQIINKLTSIVSKKNLIQTLLRNAQFNESIQEFLAQNYINSFLDVNSHDSYIFEKDNPIIRKITQNGFDVDSFLKKFAFSGFYLIRKIESWNPQLIDSISDDDFIKILKRRDGFSSDDISYLFKKRPQVLNEYANNYGNKFTYEQRLYITKLLAPQPEQIEPKPEQTQIPTQETTEEKEDEEETTTASHKIIVKVARILDYNKRYKLADKLTKKLF
jgi:hypothetical protein